MKKLVALILCIVMIFSLCACSMQGDIDFGLNPQPIGVPTAPITITQRIITNFYTAKRILHALSMTVQRHEAAFGVLEVDVQKRVRPNLQAPAK